MPQFFKKKLWPAVYNNFIAVLIALVIATSFKSAVADWNIVPTGSMKPTIIEGDRIFVNKLAYDLKIPYTTRHLMQWDHPRRGDIVVFFSPADKTRLVKRVVGVPGDRLALRDNQLFINDHKVDYQPVAMETTKQDRTGRDTLFFEEALDQRPHRLMIKPDHPAPRSFGPITVPLEHYFMLGDNRDESADSRYFGFVHRDLIVGEATGIVISLDILDLYQPRWERFFNRLD
jgi:signal peptidase I